MQRIKTALMVLAAVVTLAGCATKKNQIASLVQGVSEHNLVKAKAPKIPPRDLVFELPAETMGSLLYNLKGLVEYKILEPYLPGPTVFQPGPTAADRWPDRSRTVLCAWDQGGYRTLSLVISRKGVVDSFLINPPLEETKTSSASQLTTTASSR